MLNWLRSRNRRSDVSAASPDPVATSDPPPWSWRDPGELRRIAAGIRCPDLPTAIAAGDVIGPAAREQAWVVRGGARRIAIDGGSATLRNLIFLDGARLEIRGPCRITIEGCAFLDGDGTQRAMVPASGAIEATACLIALRGCLLAANRGADGGAIHVRDAGRLDASHCVFVDNVAESGGGALAVAGTSTAHLRHCSLIANSGGSAGALACHGTIYDVGEARLERCAVIDPPAAGNPIPGAVTPACAWHHASLPDRVTAIDCLLPQGTTGLAPGSSGNHLATPVDQGWLQWPHALGEADQSAWTPSGADLPGSWFGHHPSDRIGATATRPCGATA